ncbi:hypothetical protein BsWGS_22076 [Bradybaena similaris]
MAVYWITESLPIGVTSLLPVVLFPLLEVMSSGDVAAEYFNDTCMLFLGGLVTAIAIEYWNIHQRVAVRILMIVGSEPRWLLLGMMTATWFLSIWISNIATTAMMLPISEAIMKQLEGGLSVSKRSGAGTELQVISHSNGNPGGSEGKEDKNSSSSDSNKPTDNDQEKEKITADVGAAEVSEAVDPNFRRFCKAMSLSICYSSNAGGIASLTGTGPNLVLKGQADILYQRYGISDPVTFGTWLGYGFPLSALILITCWLWLQVAFVRGGCCSGTEEKKERAKRIRESIQEEYKKLGPLVAGQVMVSILFVALLALWITRDLGGVSGWGKAFTPEIKDGAASIVICILLFALPSTLPCLKSYSDPAHPSKWEKAVGRSASTTVRVGPLELQPLINWKVVHQKMPWHLFLLLGGGFSMSKGCEVSGLSKWIGDELQFFATWDKLAVLFLVCYITSAATEIMSNVAVATLLLPILAQLAISTGVHPLYYMFPATLASSFAFMLPVSTAPNAIVFAYGRVKVIEMAIAGFVLNILAVPLLVAMTVSVGNAIFDFNNVPPQFLNTTLVQTA